MHTAIRIGICTIPLLALSVACGRSPDVGKFTCTSGSHCPDGYVCTGSPAVIGRCVRPTAAMDAATPFDSPQTTPGSDALTSSDSPGAGRDGADAPIAGLDGGVGGAGGTTSGPDTGGAGGSGGIVTQTGGASGGGGQGTGGVGTVVGTGGGLDAGTALDTGGSGGITTGPGGATGGNGLGGGQSGGMPGTGGSTPLGTGGSTGPGTGGSTVPGTGGSTVPGTGGSTVPGTGGSTVPGTGGSTVPGTGGSGPAVAAVNLAQTKQTMVGFGIADVWASAMTEADADAIFDPSKGIGLSILRIAMGTDGNPMSGNMWSDIAKAKARGVTTFIASAWSAPANCKTNGSVNDGGYLLATCYDSWATTIAAFPALVKTNTGVDLYGMSPQNEPDFATCGVAKPCNGNYQSMLYTADEMVAFMKVVGPKLHAASPTIKVIAPEPQQWLRLWTNSSAVGSTDPLSGTGYDYGHALSGDANAWAQVDILGTHQYDTQVAQPWPSDLSQSKPVWMTEMSGIKWWPEGVPSTDISNGVVVAGWIHDAIVNGLASAWLWWWYRAINTDDNEGLLLKSGGDTKRHYTLGNFSKFIRPGYTRVDVAGLLPADILLSAYKGSDGTVVIVAINKGSAALSVPITISGGTAPASLTPYVTSSTNNLTAGSPVTLSGGGFTAALASLTVTTFVGK